jgi:hypothetical protein
VGILEGMSVATDVQVRLALVSCSLPDPVGMETMTNMFMVSLVAFDTVMGQEELSSYVPPSMEADRVLVRNKDRRTVGLLDKVQALRVHATISPAMALPNICLMMVVAEVLAGLNTGTVPPKEAVIPSCRGIPSTLNRMRPRK